MCQGKQRHKAGPTSQRRRGGENPKTTWHTLHLLAGFGNKQEAAWETRMKASGPTYITTLSPWLRSQQIL